MIEGIGDDIANPLLSLDRSKKAGLLPRLFAWRLLVNIQNKEEEKKSPSPRRRQAMSVER
jgi:hypothetical protein